MHANAVELAIWYHDAIYDPATSDNERRSSDLLRAELAGLADPSVVDDAKIRPRHKGVGRQPVARCA